MAARGMRPKVLVPNYKGIGNRDALDRKVPVNPKYQGVQGKLDTGASHAAQQHTRSSGLITAAALTNLEPGTSPFGVHRLAVTARCCLRKGRAG